MAFPVVIPGWNEAEVRTAYAGTDQRWKYGTKLVFPDGRAYRFVLNGGATLAPGDVLDGPATVGNHLTRDAVAANAGALTIAASIGATAAAKNLYRGGFASVVAGAAGGGYSYKLNEDLNIDTNAAAAGSDNLTATLQLGETLQTSLVAATHDVSFTINPYQAVIQSPITTSVSGIVGVAVKALTSGQNGWIQTRGICTVLSSGTLVIGANAVRLIAAAGAAGPGATDPFNVEVGIVHQVGSTWTVLSLTIDGG